MSATIWTSAHATQVSNDFLTPFCRSHWLTRGPNDGQDEAAIAHLKKVVEQSSSEWHRCAAETLLDISQEVFAPRPGLMTRLEHAFEKLSCSAIAPHWLLGLVLAARAAQLFYAGYTRLADEASMTACTRCFIFGS